MPFIDVAEIPAVKDILNEAIAQIKAVTGIIVHLSIHEEEDPLLVKKEALKLAICKIYHVSWAAVKSRKRTEQIIRARHAYMFLATIYLLQSQEDTATDINGMRSNVSITVKKVKGYFKVSDPEAEVIASIIAKANL